MPGLQDAVAQPARCCPELSQPHRRLEDERPRRTEPFDNHGVCRKIVELLGLSDDHGNVRKLMHNPRFPTVTDQVLVHFRKILEGANRGMTAQYELIFSKYEKELNDHKAMLDRQAKELESKLILIA